MITVKDDVFRLDTGETTYLFRKTKFGHLEHIYYGPRLPADESADVLAQKRVIPVGSSVSSRKRSALTRPADAPPLPMAISTGSRSRIEGKVTSHSAG